MPTELSEEQEKALVVNTKLLLVTYLVVNDWKFAEIVATFRLDENELVNILLKMDRLRIVNFRPPTRIVKLTARNFSWRKDGPVHAYFLRTIIPEFFNSRFDGILGAARARAGAGARRAAAGAGLDESHRKVRLSRQVCRRDATTDHHCNHSCIVRPFYSDSY